MNSKKGSSKIFLMKGITGNMLVALLAGMLMLFSMTGCSIQDKAGSANADGQISEATTGDVVETPTPTEAVDDEISANGESVNLVGIDLGQFKALQDLEMYTYSNLEMDAK